MSNYAVWVVQGPGVSPHVSVCVSVEVCVRVCESVCVVGEKTLIVEEVLMVQQLSGGREREGDAEETRGKKTKAGISSALAFLLHLVSAGPALTSKRKKKLRAQ